MTKKTYIPSGQFCSPFGLIHGLLNPTKSLPNWWKIPFKQTLHFHRARTCISFACEYLKIHPGSEVLIPAYNCGSEIDPLLQMGIKVVMYRIDRLGRIDLDDIVKKITPNTRAVYVTHYFGWPQELVNLAQICKDQKIQIIEDCALALFSQSETMPIAHFGDAAIFSLPKFLPVPDGGFLALKPAILTTHQHLKKPLSREVLHATLPFLKRWFLSSFRMPFQPHYQKRIVKRADTSLLEMNKFPDMPKSYYYDSSRFRRRMSKLTLSILNTLDIKAVIKARRHNYLILLESITTSTSIQPLFNGLPAGVCPIMLPLLVKDRHTMITWLKSHGVPAYPWWSGYHQDLDWSQFPDARYLKDHVLCLPVHQNLNDEHLNYMIKCLSDWESI